MEEVEGSEKSETKEKSCYIIVKCATLESLQKCIATGVWAFRKRLKPPQPEDILENAHSKYGNTKVILIFSVNNQHGWHGYCESQYPLRSITNQTNDRESSSNLTLTVIESDGKDDEKKVNNDNVNNMTDEWCYFPVKWITHFQTLNCYECLGLEKTKSLTLLDNSPINKARNWQEMSLESGQQLCFMIDEHFSSIINRRAAVEREKLEAIKEKESFFKSEEDSIGFCGDVRLGWRSIIEKVERDLGQVILACPYGSQRYNCSLPNSDSDILIIYQAKTVDMLGLNTPPQTLKNSHLATMDYTVLEIQRYCELLVAGDPRFVETLFIQEESILAHASDSWKKLCDLKEIVLTVDCLEKYLREAKGTKGLKQFEKWKAELKSCDIPSPKMNKLAYIILRLLQSARDMVTSNHINVYRQEGLQQQQELLDARLGKFTVSYLTSIFDSYLSEIDRYREGKCFSQTNRVKCAIQDWLVTERLHDLELNKTLRLKE